MIRPWLCRKRNLQSWYVGKTKIENELEIYSSTPKHWPYFSGNLDHPSLQEDGLQLNSHGRCEAGIRTKPDLLLAMSRGY